MNADTDSRTLKVSSPGIFHEGILPMKYTCRGRNINPALNIENMPRDCKSLVLVLEDNDAPSGSRVHWLVWNIPVTSHLVENADLGTCGWNDFNQRGYTGPNTTQSAHRYSFHIYALNDLLNISPTIDVDQLQSVISSHIIAKGKMDVLFR